MNIRKAIHKDSISRSLKGKNKTELIEELLDLIVRTGRIQDRKTALKCILAREKKMSTGMHHGLAIPHGKTDTLDTLVASVGLVPEGVDFDSQDGQPTRIFILTVSPENRAGPHIQFLAEISSLLNREDIRRQILAASTDEELHELLTSE
jgi:PTS system nitrogen regulatory IIA component